MIKIRVEVLPLLAIWLVSVSPGLAQSGTHRNLDKYDKFGPIEAGVFPDEIAKVSSDLRQFLWEHWYQHKLGIATVASWSPFEWVPETIRYYVEPEGSSGRWCIRIDSQIAARPNHPKASRLRWTAISVERMVFDKTLSKTPVPEGTNPPPDSYNLLLKSKDGKKVWL